MTQIFRHLRPTWYDSESHEIKVLPNGGISFLLSPTAEKQYDYWIYICPKDAQFSTKQAVKSLRLVVERNVVPWGHITLSNLSLQDELLRSVTVSGGDGLFTSDLISQVDDILQTNAFAEYTKSKMQWLNSNKKKEYENN